MLFAQDTGKIAHSVRYRFLLFAQGTDQTARSGCVIQILLFDQVTDQTAPQGPHVQIESYIDNCSLL